MNDGYVQIEERETDRIAGMLAQAITQSDEYITYQNILKEIKEQPELYEQVNSLRRVNFMMQNGGDGHMSREDYQSLSELSKNLRKDPLVNRFLDAEVGFGRLMQDINRIIFDGIDFDNEFLN